MISRRLRRTVATLAIAALALVEAPAALAAVPAAAPAAEAVRPGGSAEPANTAAPAETDALPGGSATPRSADRRSGDLPFAVTDGTRLVDLNSRFLCAQQGRVRVSGPAAIIVTGFATCRGGVWRMKVDGGVGKAGGMDLTPANFSGVLTSDRGRPGGAVRIDLPRHPRVVPLWRMDAELTMAPDGRAWRSAVVVTQSRGASTLRMTGSLDPGIMGSYSLRAQGTVAFAGTSIAVSGRYRSGLRTSEATWLISGSGQAGRVDGAVLAQPRVTMSDRIPGVTGSATIQLVQPTRMAIPARLHVVDARNWRAEARGSSTPLWRPEGLADVVAATARLSGDISVERGKTTWALQAPMVMRERTLDIRGTVTIEGPQRWRLAATGGRAQILGSTVPLTISAGRGSALFDRGRATGSIGIVVGGELLFDLPEAWRSETAYRLIPRASRSGDISFDHQAAHIMTTGRTRLQLTGAVPPTGGFRLEGGGQLEIAGTTVPFAGFYESAGFSTAGRPNASPRWAMGGRVDRFVRLDGGAGISGGILRFTSRTPSGPAARSGYDNVDVEVTGDTTVQLSIGDDFELNCEFTYDDPDNWSLTAAGNRSDIWMPYFGLSIPDIDFTGTIVSVDGEETWDVVTAPVTWSGFVTGATMSTSFTIGNECPLKEHCPPASGDDIFVGSTTAAIDFSSIPDVTATGAFTADLDWLRWDATSAPVTFNGITIEEPDITAFTGARDDADPDLEMPDLSATGGGNGIQIQLCGEFTVPVPDIQTFHTHGCVGWTEAGVVMGQVETGGDIETGTYNGISINGAGLSGFGWTDLTSAPTIGLNGLRMALDDGRQYITANVGIPGNVMHDFGTGTSTDTLIPAEGWFDFSGNFELDATIPVGLKGNTVSIDAILAHIGKVGRDYQLSFEADGDIKINSRHYPIEAYIGVEKSTETSITVRVSVKGTYSSITAGSFDVSSLLTEGDFEPPNADIIDGSFDGKQNPNVFTDGTFEGAGQQPSLVTNPDFEDGVPGNLLVDDSGNDLGSFEGLGNMLENNGFEDTGLLLNGDFEGLNGSVGQSTGAEIVGWPTNNGNIQPSRVDGSAPTSTNPLKDSTGSYVMKVVNSGPAVAGGAKPYQGVTQYVPQPMSNGTTYALGAWAASATGSSVSFQMAILGDGCSNVAVDKTFTVTTTWSFIELRLAGTSAGCKGFFVYLTPLAGNGSAVLLDDVTFAPTTALPPGTPIAYAYGPHIVHTFDTTAGLSVTNPAKVYPASDNSGGKWLQSTGCDGWLYTATGMVDGDFDMRTRVLFGGGSGWDIANVGFWLTDNGGGKYTGYALRLDTEYGIAFVTANKGSMAFAGEPSTPKLPGRNVWYDVHLTAQGNLVTGVVTDLQTNEQVYNGTIFLRGELPYKGYFGQIPDGACQGGGQGWDDLTIYTMYKPQERLTEVIWDPATARSGNAYASLSGPAGSGWSAVSSTGIAPEQGRTYSYTTWVRASAGSVSGNLLIETESQGNGTSTGNVAREAISIPFTATSSSWTRVTGTITIANAGHTDLRAGVEKVITSSGTRLLMDDQLLQEISWRSGLNSPDTSLWTTTDDSGNSVLNYSDSRGYPSALYYDFDRPAASGATYTITMDVRSDAPIGGATLKWFEGTSAQYTEFTTGTAWKTITMKVTPANTVVPTLALYLAKGTIQVDNVFVTVSDISSNRGGTLGVPPAPQGWSSTGEAPWTSLGSAAHSGRAVMTVYGNTSASYAAVPSDGSAIRSGSVYSASLWVLASDSSSRSGTVSLAATGTADVASVDFTTSGGWKQVTVNLPIKSSNATGLTLTIRNSTGTLLLVDDITLNLQGLTLKDPWTSMGSGGNTYSVMGVLQDSSQAHSGSNYLQFQPQNGTAGVRLTSAFSPTPLTQVTHAAWVRSPSGKRVDGSIYLATNGNPNSRSTPFTLTDSSWHYVYVTLPIFDKSASTLISQITSATPGVSVQIDDVTTRVVTPWYPFASANTNMSIVTDASRATDGSGYLTMTGYDSGWNGVWTSIAQDDDSKPITVKSGDTYVFSAYVRSTRGQPVNGALQLGFDGTPGSPGTVPFTATGDWQLVSGEVAATRDAKTINPTVLISGPGQLDVDSITVTPKMIVQDQPWRTEVVSGSPRIDWGVYDDPSRARDGSLGLLELSKSGSGIGGVVKDVDVDPQPGEVYTMSAWVRSPSGSPISGYIQVDASNGTGATYEYTQVPFTASGDWQLVTARLAIKNSGHIFSSARVHITDNSGATLDVDDVSVQLNDWQVTGWGSTAVQTIVNDGASAQQGTGYLSLTNDGSGTVAAYYDSQATYAAGAQQFMTAWVRSASGAPITGYAELGATSGGTQAASVWFTATSQWTKVTVPFTPSSTMSVMRMLVSNTTPNSSLEIDTVNITDQTGAIDGVTTPLPHPERGYAYLWDDAFGIKGAHLWSITGQIAIINGKPAIGVGATMYFDPTKSPGPASDPLMTGTAWIKGDMELQVSYPPLNSCFGFDFNAGDTGSAVSIAGGALKATEFSLYVAPKGCTIGDYALPMGASLSFDAALGEGTVHLDLAVGVDDDNAPYARGSVGVHDLVIGGTTFKTMDLSADITAEGQDVSFVGDFIMPMGLFNGAFDMSAKINELYLQGDVHVTDWKMAGGGFKVNSFNYFMELKVPFGNPCGSMTEVDTDGDMEMAKRTGLKFRGRLSTECGQLKVLTLAYDYYHGGFKQEFRIDYDASTYLLSGGAFFAFERSFSWKFLSHRYRRHPAFSIGLAYSMDVRHPESAGVSLGGTVQVSGGSGEVKCSINGGAAGAWGPEQDDGCSLKVTIKKGIGGGRTYTAEW